MPKLWNEKPVFTRGDVETEHIGKRLHVEVAANTFETIDDLLSQTEEVTKSKKGASMRDPSIEAKQVDLNTVGWVRKVIEWTLSIGWQVALGVCWAVFLGIDREASDNCLSDYVCPDEAPLPAGCVESDSDEITIDGLKIAADVYCSTTAREIGGVTLWRLTIFLFFLWPIQLASRIPIRLITMAVSLFSSISKTFLTADVRHAAAYTLRSGLWLALWRILMEATVERSKDAERWNEVAGREIWPTGFANTYDILTDVLIVLLLWDASSLLKVIFSKFLAVQFHETAHASMLKTTYMHERLLEALLRPFRMGTKVSITLGGRTTQLKGIKVAHWKAVNFMASVKAQHETLLETVQDLPNVEAQHVQRVIDKADQVINTLSHHLANDVMRADRSTGHRHIITPWLDADKLTSGIDAALVSVHEGSDEAVSLDDLQQTTSQSEILGDADGPSMQQQASNASSIREPVYGSATLVENPTAKHASTDVDSNQVDAPRGQGLARRTQHHWRKAAQDVVRPSAVPTAYRSPAQSSSMRQVPRHLDSRMAPKEGGASELNAVDFQQAVKMSMRVRPAGRSSSIAGRASSISGQNTTTIYGTPENSVHGGSMVHANTDSGAAYTDNPASFRQSEGMEPVCEISEVDEGDTTAKKPEKPMKPSGPVMPLLQRLKAKSTVHNKTDLWSYMKGNSHLKLLAIDAAEHSDSEQAMEYSRVAARKLGYYLFWNLHPGRDMLALTQADFVEALERQGRNYHDEYFEIFDKNGSGSVTLEETISAVEAIYDQRKHLARTLSDNEVVIRQVTQAFGGLLFVVLIFAAVAIFDTGTFARTWTSLSAGLISLSFIFGGSVKEMFENTLFLFINHPFDVGDLIQVDGERYEVMNIALTYVVLKKPNGAVINSPLSELRVKDVYNMNRSGPLWNGLDFVVDASVYMEALEALGEAVKTAIILESSNFGGNYRVFLTDTSPTLKVTVSIYYDYADNGADLLKMNLAKTALILAAHESLRRANITYTFPANAGSDLVGDNARRMFMGNLNDQASQEAAASQQNDIRRADLAAAGAVLTLT